MVPATVATIAIIAITAVAKYASEVVSAVIVYVAEADSLSLISTENALAVIVVFAFIEIGPEYTGDEDEG